MYWTLHQSCVINRFAKWHDYSEYLWHVIKKSDFGRWVDHFNGNSCKLILHFLSWEVLNELVWILWDHFLFWLRTTFSVHVPLHHKASVDSRLLHSWAPLENKNRTNRAVTPTDCSRVRQCSIWGRCWRVSQGQNVVSQTLEVSPRNVGARPDGEKGPKMIHGPIRLLASFWSRSNSG